MYPGSRPPPEKAPQEALPPHPYVKSVVSKEQRPGYLLGYALFALVIVGLFFAVYQIGVHGQSSTPARLATGAEFFVLGVMMMLANPLAHTSFFFRFWIGLLPLFNKPWRDNPATLYVLGGVFALAGGAVALSA